MKKFLMILVCLILVSTVAICEAIDFSSISDEELQELYASIVTEMNARSMEQAVYVPNGHYAIGTDIPAGSYVITSVDAEKGSSFTTYESYEDYEDAEFIHYYSVFHGFNEGQLVTLEEGQYIAIYNPVLFLKYSLGF